MSRVGPDKLGIGLELTVPAMIWVKSWLERSFFCQIFLDNAADLHGDVGTLVGPNSPSDARGQGCNCQQRAGCVGRRFRRAARLAFVCTRIFTRPFW